MLTDFLFIILALGMLVAGAEALVRGSASLALRIGLTPLTIGLTVVAFGTSSPELVVSLKAAFAGQGDISIGNVVGSNIFNIGAILGITALICPIAVQWQLIKIDGPIMVAVSVLAYLLLRDGTLSRLEGILLVAGIIAYTAMNARLARQKTSEAVIEEFEEGIPRSHAHWSLDGVLIVGGLAVLIWGSELLVTHSVSFARALGVSEAVIGLTIIAAGTSMPELATSLVAALRKEPDIAIGNVIGSNIFNLLSILGFASLVHPIHSDGVRFFDFMVMIAFAAILLPILWTGRKIQRLEGAALLAGFFAYLFVLWPKG